MCGIAGIWGGGDVVAMTRRLVHRGPDDEGFYRDGPVQLGVRRLSVIDLVTGHQPLSTADGKLWIAYNGELFNYVELREELEKRGRRFRTKSDTEVVVTAYEEWGASCLARFIGMFAFAIWDGRQLFLARDRFGEKPLFYTREGGRFLFASEIKALLAEVPARPNLDERFFVLEAAVEPETLFKDVWSLEPGHFLTYDGRELRVERYWSLPEGELDTRSEEEQAEELLALLTDAVRLRLRSEVPVGLFLSGGLDSSILAALAKPEKVFVCRLPYGDAYDEFVHAETMARALGIEPVTVLLTPEDFRREYPRIIWHLDQPIATTSSAAEFALARIAREHVTVVLGGQGSDEAFGGYVRHVLLTEEERLAGSELLKNYQPMARILWGGGVFGDPAERYYRLIKRSAGKDGVAEKMRAIFARRGSLVDKMGAADFALTFPSLILMNDRAAASYGLENRTPFLDHRIVEFAFRLPQQAKIRGFTTKAILRRVARGLVPDSIVDRRDKKGLGVPLNRWLREELKSWADDLCHGLARRGIDVVAQGAERGEFDRSLFTRVSLELWFRTFIDGKGDGPIA